MAYGAEGIGITMANGSEHAGWVEMRVHGVSGTPPEDVLGSAFVTQIAGNDRGRIFARADALRTAQPVSGGRWLEAYHWGQHTSGSWRQGLWLLLIPFALVNAASFMLPKAEHGVGRLFRVVANAMLRLVGLCLSGIFAFAIAYVFVDLLAWQWVPGRFDLLPGSTALVVAGFVAAVVMIELLYLLPGRNNRDVRASTGVQHMTRGTAHSHTRLRDRRFFDGDADAPVLRALHRSAAVLVITLLVALSVIEDSPLVPVTKLALLAVAVVVVLLGDRRDMDNPTPPGWHKLVARLRHLVVVAVHLLALATAVQIARDGVSGRLDQAAELSPVDALSLTLMTWTLAALAILLLACAGLAVATRKQWLNPAAFRPYALGTGAYWLASAGVFIGVGYAAAVAEGISYTLDVEERSPILERVAYAWGVTALLIVAVAIAVGLRLLLTWRGHGRRVADMYSRVGRGRGLPSTWVPRVGFAVAVSRLKNLVAPILITFGVAAIVLSGAAGYEMCGSRLAGTLAMSDSCTSGSAVSLDGVFDRLSNEAQAGQFDRLVPLGTWTLLAFAGLLLLLGRKAVRLRGTRRAVNVLWDVVSFWPRAVHPLVPAAYARQVVPELVDRIGYHLDRHPTRRLVLAGHSQGSLIVFAAVLWLRPDQLARLGLVTHGSQLQTSFSRGFPAYVNLDVIQGVMNDLDGRWINLYRETDPLAGPVLSWSHEDFPKPTSVSISTSWDWRDRSPAGDTVHTDTGRRDCLRDWRLLDPMPVDLGLQVEPLCPAKGHSSYYADPAWEAAIARVRGRLPQQPSASLVEQRGRPGRATEKSRSYRGR